MKTKILSLLLFLSVFVGIQFFSANNFSAAQTNVSDKNNAWQENSSEINSVRTSIYDWLNAWRSKEISVYMSHYSPEFQTRDLDYAALLKKKARLFKRPGTISLEIFYLMISIDRNHAYASFLQRYKDVYNSDIGEKNITLVNSNGKWKIVEEEWKPIDAPAKRDF